MAEFILASSSPRRRELLSLYGFPFLVIPGEVEEEGVTGTGRERVEKLALLKCEAVAVSHPKAFVLSADTLVCIGDQVLGKPGDARQAREMLLSLSGREHRVYTGVCLHTPSGELLRGVEETRVRFLPLAEKWIDRYIATGEPFDKAGAYAIQGKAGIFVEGITGSPSNVIGLPLGLVTEFLEKAGVDFPAYPES